MIYKVNLKKKTFFRKYSNLSTTECVFMAYFAAESYTPLAESAKPLQMNQDKSLNTILYVWATTLLA